MSIDWFTFTAQIINFLVLVVLLRWFLYGPIVRAMQQREEKITHRLEEAARREADAEQAANEFHLKQRELEDRRDELMKEARQDAQTQREEMIKQARKEVAQDQERWRQSLVHQREDLLADVKQQAARLAVAASARTLKELADVDLEERMCRVLIKKLESLDTAERQTIATHLRDGEAMLQLRSQFELSPAVKSELTTALRTALGYEGKVTFHKSDDVICGLEMEAGGYSYDWNVAGLVHQFERKLRDELQF